MSSMPFSVRVAIRIDVPRNPVCKQRSCCAKFSRRRSIIFALASPSTSWFFRADKGGVCIVLRMAVLKVPSSLRKFFFEVGLCRIGHLLVLGGIATGGGSHIPHHESIYHPVGSAQIVPIADGIRKRALGRESESATTFQWFVAQPVSPLVVAVLTAEGLVVIFGVVDVVHKQVHGVPALLNNLRITELLPYRPRHDDSGIGPTQTLFSSPYCAKGATPGNPPKLFWVSRMSRIHL